MREPGSEERIWWGEINRPIEEAQFEGLRAKVADYLGAQERLYVIDAFAGADPDAPDRRARRHREPVPRALREDDVHPADRGGARRARAAGARAARARRSRPTPRTNGTRTGTFVVLHPTRGEVLIGGTFYAGEIKKSIFTVMNDRLPLEGVFPMHCSANVGPDGDVAIFFGLSGTGKTTLSADPSRSLIGDDEHGWGTSGVFNIEGGCYAKVIRLSAEAEPDIFRTTHTFGTILENVAVDERGVVDLDDDSKTENTRAAYELEQIPNAHPSKMAGHPRNVVFLTADAFGILPPIARLTREQAQYWFLSGFTAKLAGTEIGVTEPQPTFSTCFGAPFMPAAAAASTRGCSRRSSTSTARPSGSSTRAGPGGAFGEGHRMPIKATRALLAAALSGALDDAECRVDPSSASRCRSRCRASTRRSSTRARPGPTPRPTTRRRRSSRRCSARTSRSASPPTPTLQSPPPARADTGSSWLGPSARRLLTSPGNPGIR